MAQPGQFSAHHAFEFGRGGGIGHILFGLALQVSAVVAVVAACFAIRHLHNPAGHPVEHVTVVGHQHHRAGVAIEPTLQPFHGCSIEVVGGLIKQQHIRAGHQCRSQTNPLAISTGEVFDRFVQIANAEALQHLLALLLQPPGLGFIHALAEMSEFGELGGVVWVLGDSLGEGAEAQQQVAFLTATGQHLLQHREPWLHNALLAHQLHPQAR